MSYTYKSWNSVDSKYNLHHLFYHILLFNVFVIYVLLKLHTVYKASGSNWIYVYIHEAINIVKGNEYRDWSS